MIAALIGYESVARFFQPVPIHFAEAIPIACLGLTINVVSAWLLSGDGHHHHDHHHGHDEDDGDAPGHADHDADHHGHADRHVGAHRDNNMRAAMTHVVADAAVSILVILGLVLAATAILASLLRSACVSDLLRRDVVAG